MNDVFVRALESGLIDVETDSVIDTSGLAPWLLQEPIEVLGVLLTIFPSVQSENDGLAWCEASVSPASHVIRNGALIFGWAAELWNTTPAAAQLVPFENVVMFGEKDRPRYAEGQTLQINVSARGKSAGIAKFYIDALVYWRPTRGVRR